MQKKLQVKIVVEYSIWPEIERRPIVGSKTGCLVERTGVKLHVGYWDRLVGSRYTELNPKLLHTSDTKSSCQLIDDDFLV